MIRAIGYYRKSNDDRKNNKNRKKEDDRKEGGKLKEEIGESIRQQRAWAAEACPRAGVLIVQEFEDQSVSGLETERRSGFMRMIEFCEQQAKLGKPVEAVVCWHANRFSRANSLETSAYLFRLIQAGTTQMLTATKWIDFNRSEDRMIFGLEQEATSHRFSVDLSAACRRGKKANAEQGLWNGGRVPFGYRVEGGRFVVDPGPAEAVRVIFDTYASGRGGVRKLADMLADRGIPSPNGGRLWNPQTLTELLKNPAYLGHLVTGRRTDGRFLGAVRVPVAPAGKRTRYTRHRPEDWTVRENTHPAIIPQELFDRVQARFGGNRKRTSPNRSFVLSGLVRCGGCGGPMIGRTFNNKANPHYYTCGKYSQHGKASGCHLNAVPEDRLLTAVANKLAEAYFNEENMTALRDEIRRQEHTPDRQDRAERLKARIEELKRKVAAGVRRLIDLPADLSAEFEAGLVEAKGEQTRLERELEALELAAVPAEDVEAKIDAILGRMSRFRELLTADPVGANVVLREMIDRVVLHFDHGDERKSRVRNRFARGAIYLSAASSLASSDSSGVKGPATRCR